MDPAELIQILEQEYELTGNPRDRVAVDELIVYLRERNIMRVSDRLISLMLTQIGLGRHVRREGRRTVRVRTGVLRRADLVA